MCVLCRWEGELQQLGRTEECRGDTNPFAEIDKMKIIVWRLVLMGEYIEAQKWISKCTRPVILEVWLGLSITVSNSCFCGCWTQSMASSFLLPASRQRSYGGVQRGSACRVKTEECLQISLTRPRASLEKTARPCVLFVESGHPN